MNLPERSIDGIVGDELSKRASDGHAGSCREKLISWRNRMRSPLRTSCVNAATARSLFRCAAPTRYIGTLESMKIKEAAAPLRSPEA